MTLVFSRFSFILHLAHHFANYRRSLRKSFAANCTFLLAAYRAVSSANWDFELSMVNFETSDEKHSSCNVRYQISVILPHKWKLR